MKLKFFSLHRQRTTLQSYSRPQEFPPVQVPPPSKTRNYDSTRSFPKCFLRTFIIFLLNNNFKSKRIFFSVFSRYVLLDFFFVVLICPRFDPLFKSNQISTFNIYRPQFRKITRPEIIPVRCLVPEPELIVRPSSVGDRASGAFYLSVGQQAVNLSA